MVQHGDLDNELMRAKGQYPPQESYMWWLGPAVGLAILVVVLVVLFVVIGP